MWIVAMTIGDLPSAANQLRLTHWRATLKALQYIRRTRNPGVTYGGEPEGGTELSAWVDAGRGTCLHTCRSVSGGVVTMGRRVIPWSS